MKAFPLLINMALTAESEPGPGSGSAKPVIEMRGVMKNFPGVRALDNVDFELYPGEVHVLFGENGAGKSTLSNIIAGTFPPDGGEFYYNGTKVTGLTPYQARLIGISSCFQDFSLVPDLTVSENIFLGREIGSYGMVNKKKMLAKATRTFADLGFNLSANTRVRDLSRANQQMTEIAKALLYEVKVLILDEPTASLTEGETARLFELIPELKSKGVGIIYISHRMAEIRTIGDRITVLRDGQKIGTVNSVDVTESQLIKMMTGRKVDVLFPQIDHKPSNVLLETKNICAEGRVEGININVSAGEIVGMASLVGGGKSYLARLIFGLEKYTGGEILVGGQPVARPSPSKMLGLGVCYFPSDRVAEGLALPRSICENASMCSLTLPAYSVYGVLRRRNERTGVQRVVDLLNIKPGKIDVPVANLSGGNRQKVTLGRAFLRQIRVFLFDEPTLGIDIGAKIEVYGLLKQLVEAGKGILLISSELPELLHLSNRLYVMNNGRLAAELTGENITEKNVLMSFYKK